MTHETAIWPQWQLCNIMMWRTHTFEEKAYILCLLCLMFISGCVISWWIYTVHVYVCVRKCARVCARLYAGLKWFWVWLIIISPNFANISPSAVVISVITHKYNMDLTPWLNCAFIYRPLLRLFTQAFPREDWIWNSLNLNWDMLVLSVFEEQSEGDGVI